MYLGGIVLALATFVVSLDLTIVNVILPHIAAGFGATPNEGTLSISFFAAAQAIMMPLTGWLARRFGTVKVFVGGIIGFGITSFLCGIAPSLPALVVFRALQGAAAGPMLPLVQALLQRSFTKAQLPTAFTLWSVAVATGPLLGPIFGGYLADTVGWHWAFLINVPICVLCVVIALRVFGNKESQTQRVPVDYVGLILLIVWVGATQFVLDKGRELDWFGSPLIIFMTVVAVTGFIAFMIWELTDAHPLIDFSVFKIRSFYICTPISAVSNSTQTTAALLLGLWLQTNLDYTASWAGLAIATMGIPALIAGPVVAGAVKRIDSRALVTFGLTATGLSFLWRFYFPTQTDFAHIMAPQLLYGFCAPFSYGPLLALAMSDVPTEKLAMASGFIQFARAFGTAVVISVATTFWQDGATSTRSVMSGEINLHGLEGAMNLDRVNDLTALSALVQQESVTLSTQHMFLVLSAMIMVGAVLIWLAPRPKRTDDPLPVE